MTKTALWLIAAALPAAAIAQTTPQTVPPAGTNTMPTTGDTGNSLSTDIPANTTATPTDSTTADSTTNTTTSDQSAMRTKPSKKNKKPMGATE